VIIKIISQQEQIGVQFIKELFPHKIVKEFDLVKSKIEARDNALHLDCCFQPIGPDKGLFIRADFVKKQTICIWLLFLEG
jgi:hypothetical protein